MSQLFGALFYTTLILLFMWNLPGHIPTGKVTGSKQARDGRGRFTLKIRWYGHI